MLIQETCSKKHLYTCTHMKTQTHVYTSTHAHTHTKDKLGSCPYGSRTPGQRRTNSLCQVLTGALTVAPVLVVCTWAPEVPPGPPLVVPQSVVLSILALVLSILAVHPSFIQARVDPSLYKARMDKTTDCVLQLGALGGGVMEKKTQLGGGVMEKKHLRSHNHHSVVDTCPNH